MADSSLADERFDQWATAGGGACEPRFGLGSPVANEYTAGAALQGPACPQGGDLFFNQNVGGFFDFKRI